jgi:type IV secretory pathway TrbD component
MTTRPVFTVFNGPIVMGFVERRLLIPTIAAAVAVLVRTEAMELALLTFAIGYGYAYWTRNDPYRLAVLLRAMRTRTYYDPSAYRRTERVIQ